MTGRELIDLAKTSELKQLGFRDNDDVILGYLNLALIEMYKRFPIKVEEYMLALEEGVGVYTLPSNCMSIIAAYGEVEETSPDLVNIIPINEEDNPLSLNTISWNKVQIPITTNGAYISIIYVASPTLLTVDDLDNELEMPVQMVEAVMSFIGYKAHSSVTSADTENNIHYNRFEASCKRIDSLGLFARDDLYMNTRLAKRGFV